MTMRARDPKDYKQGDTQNLSEGEPLGKMGGKYKDIMNSMFDTRGKESENF